MSPSGPVNGQSSSHPETSDPWEFPVVLSLDGGGIRGLSSLLILKAIFIEVAKIDADHEHDDSDEPDVKVARPCHYFDHVVGTSTGGQVIEVLLPCRLRMKIQDAISVYLRFGKEVFGNPRVLLLNRYSAKRLEDILKNVLREACPDNPRGGEEERLVQRDRKEDRQRRCMTSVVALKEWASNVAEVWLFRSYDHIPSQDPDLGEETNQGFTEVNNPRVRIWEVARATTAAPTYFDVMRIGDGKYMDGGLKANNPAQFAWNNARQISRNEDHLISAFISVGTGLAAGSSPFGHALILGNLLALLRFARYRLSDTEITHKHIQNVVDNQREPKTFYRRLNVDNGLDGMKLDEWKSSGRIKKALRMKKLGFARKAKREPPPPDDDLHVPRFVSRTPTEDAEPILSGHVEYETVHKIETATRSYLGRKLSSNEYPAVVPVVRECAEKLVDIAKARRAADMARWQYFVEQRETPRTSWASKNFKEQPPNSAARVPTWESAAG